MAGPAAPPPRPASRRGPSAFLLAVALAWTAAVLCYGFVWGADPYELRFARPSERLADHPYPAQVVPRLVSVAAHGGADMVILGASTAMGYTPNMMRQAFTDVSRPANLAYACASAEDFGVLLPRLEQSKTLKRVLINLDVSLITPCVGNKSDFDPRYFASNWLDPAPEFNLQSVELSQRVLRTGVLDLDAWRPLPDDKVSWITTDPPVTAKPDYLARVRRNVALARGRATRGAPLPCSSMPRLKTTIAPFIRTMAARGVKVDLLAPPLSLAIYSEWTVSWTPFTAPPFPSVMALQRCLLQMTAGLPNVRFDSFDTDPAIVGDLRLYRDTGHVGDVETYRQILRRIAAGQAQVTLDEWPQHQAALQREVDAFSP
ncbi:MAG TPA: hypothetical protein VGG29_05525 [Caulobacteraceae bacterium]|jgi:hypothetical protein